MKHLGAKTWAIVGGHIPLRTNGEEPEFTSQDQLCILNSGPQEAAIELTIFYADRDPVGPYRLKIPAQRTRHVRVNDLIDPIPVPLDVPYGGVIESDVPVVVQFLRRDTSQAENSWLGLSAMALGG